MAPTQVNCCYVLNSTQQEAMSALQVCVMIRLPGQTALSPIHYTDFELAHDVLTQVDQKLLHWLTLAAQQQLSQANPSHILLQGELGHQILPQLLATGHCHWQTLQNPPLKQSLSRAANLEWVPAAQGRKQLICHVSGGNCSILALKPLWYIDPQGWAAGIVNSMVAPEVIIKLLSAPPMTDSQITALTSALSKSSVQPATAKAKAVTPLEVAMLPSLHLCMIEVALPNPYDKTATLKLKMPAVELRFHYQGIQIAAFDSEHRILMRKGSKDYLIEREQGAEQQALNDIGQFDLSPLHQFPDIHLTKDDGKRALFLLGAGQDADAWLRFNIETLPKIRALQWQVHISPDYPYQVVDESQVEWYTQLYDTAGHKWFNIELGISIQGEKINLLPILVAAIEKFIGPNDKAPVLPKDGFVLTKLPDGRLLPVPVLRLKPILDVLTELYDRQTLNKQGRLKLSRLRAAQLLALEKNVAEHLRFRWWGNKQLEHLIDRLADFKHITPAVLPVGLQTELRQYQQEGLSWLQFLREYDLGGVLADDMGLGKTVQALAHILIEKEQGRLIHPCLVVAPTSLMTNWRLEAQRFTPSLSVLVLHGTDRQEHFDHLANFDIILTTYPLVVRDHAILAKQNFYLLILDEAQTIKNARSKAALLMNKLTARHRLCLTGTPLENHLGELWSLFNFLMPGFLGDSKQFTRLFRTPIEKQQDHERKLVLQKRVAPFLLRRTKQKVAIDLPEKNEILCNIELEGAQRDLYESIRLALHESVQLAVEQKGIANSQLIILDALLKLRQICCDPRLLKLESSHKQNAASAKLEYLKQALPNLVEEGRQVLLFSQFTEMLGLIEQEVQAMGIAYVKLTGQTQDRATPIEQFQNKEVPLFLISLKAGGLGLNLTAADTVIHYDPWWNPAVERQATDRAHRIGQNKHVFVYKLITTGTVEEKIIALQDKKQHLLESIYGDSDSSHNRLTAEDLKLLLANL